MLLQSSGLFDLLESLWLCSIPRLFEFNSATTEPFPPERHENYSAAMAATRGRMLTTFTSYRVFSFSGRLRNVLTWRRTLESILLDHWCITWERRRSGQDEDEIVGQLFVITSSLINWTRSLRTCSEQLS